MTEVTIRGISVSFPYQVYDIQKDYMEKVIECLQTEKNGVLESPTGTGKTLSLLCSSLAWLCSQKALLQMKYQGIENASDDYLHGLQKDLEKLAGSSTWNPMLKPPRIIYASRTHSQLSQVMVELKKTAYRHVKVGVLGSRDHLCIHPKVCEEPNAAAKTNMCKMLVSSRACQFYNNVENRVQDPAFQEDRLIDIEDLITKSRKLHCCPYYMSRELQNDADILFTPYNYLLDPKTRKAHDIKLTGDVVILDEGHNVEKVCEESASSQLSSTVVALCINEVTSIMKMFHNEIQQNFGAEDTNLPKDFTADDLCLLKTMFMIIEKAIDEIPLQTVNSRQCATFQGSYIFSVLEKAQIVSSKLPTLLEVLQKVTQYLISSKESSSHRKAAGLLKFTEFLEIVFNTSGKNNSREYADLFYKLHVEEEIPKSTKKADTWSIASGSTKNGKILNFWCFSPSFGMKSLIGQGTRCVILTSGTLTPLSATISEIGIPVEVQLTNPHIIKSNQVYAAVVENGPGNTELRCVYQNRSNKVYLTDLGQTCLNLYRLIPGGVLVFFPSYPFLQFCIQHWQEIGLWNKLILCKNTFVEPESKGAFKSVIEEYYKCITEKSGASLFAVCRGKISEGMDFADTRARAVIVIGLPFPPYNDPKVELKRAYLDAARSSLSGSEWYKLEAMRAVNQAVGRVIRHKDDYGAIIFCDNRYSYSTHIKSLSAWLQSYVTCHKSFGHVVRTISTFFRNWKELPIMIQTSEDTRCVGAHFNSVFSTSTRKMQPAQCLAPVSSSTESVNDITKLYSDVTKISDKARSSVLQSRTILDSLEDYNCSVEHQTGLSVPHHEEQSLTNRSESKEGSGNVHLRKKRKITLVPLVFDNKQDEEFDVKRYVLKLQKMLDPEGMKKFRATISEYSLTSDYDTFFAAISTLFLKDKNLKQFYKDIPHFLKTDEHKQKFWEQYNSAMK